MVVTDEMISLALTVLKTPFGRHLISSDLVSLNEPLRNTNLIKVYGHHR